MELTSITPEPEALRALAHPVRLRILGILRHEGPATASGLATRLGLNSGATSYHLRQLAQHGFIVDDAERGTGRDRWWQAAHQATVTDPADLDMPEDRDSFDAFMQAVAVVNTERLQRAVEERALLPRAWQDASTLSDLSLHLTPARARALVDAVIDLIREWDEEPEDGDDVADFVITLQAYVRPGTLAIAPDEGTP
ncbi:ArsR/SmtB family transcription factor [Nocardioides speluncae]|uniref:ArsR/SmtB family transcription factor n=1 Tax=Nocardioides speluncae TaxID=2670337 RepID=UPI000D691514|nr:helix-turn-helix domain-containing protein [Nocardioides speluncae]